MIYETLDSWQSFYPLSAIDELPSRSNWTFFYPPFNAGHIHGFAVHKDSPECIFAGVEHGALIYSRDGGQTWSETLVGHDVHRVAFDPTNPDRVLVADGSGLLESLDGMRWSVVPALRGKYCHGIVFDLKRPERAYAYAASGGDPIFVSHDGGRQWIAAGGSLPSSRQADPIALHPGSEDAVFFAGDVSTDASRLFVSVDSGANWTPLDPELPKIWRLKTGYI